MCVKSKIENSDFSDLVKYICVDFSNCFTYGEDRSNTWLSNNVTITPNTHSFV